MKICYIAISFIGLLASILLLIREGFNPISRLALLIIIFLMAAFSFLFLDFYFLGLTYIIVYIGAITILFLFVIMVLRTGSPLNINLNNDESSWWWKGIKPFGLGLLLISLIKPFGLGEPSLTYFYPSWSFDYLYLTDIQSLGFTLFLAYPIVLLLLGLI